MRAASRSPPGNWRTEKWRIRWTDSGSCRRPRCRQQRAPARPRRGFSPWPVVCQVADSLSSAHYRVSPSDAKAQPDCTAHTMSDITPPLDGLSLLSGPDRPDLNRGEVLADLFAATAHRVPEQTALLAGERRLTYGELDDLAERVATRLVAAGVGPGQIVGLWLPRGIDLLVMQLGIAKSGAAWLPFDSETPVDRIMVCLADAGAAQLSRTTGRPRRPAVDRRSPASAAGRRAPQ